MSPMGLRSLTKKCLVNIDIKYSKFFVILLNLNIIFVDNNSRTVPVKPTHKTRQFLMGHKGFPNIPQKKKSKKNTQQKLNFYYCIVLINNDNYNKEKACN